MRGDFRGCRYFVMFRPPSLLAPQIVPTAANTPAGQPGLLRPSRTRFVASPRIGYANRPKTGNWRCGDLHPARLRPCRLLLPLALPLGPVASEFDPARRAAAAADAAMVGRSPGRVPRAPLGAAAERRAGRHVAGIFSQQLVRGAPRRLSHPPVDRRTAALR